MDPRGRRNERVPGLLAHLPLRSTTLWLIALCLAAPCLTAQAGQETAAERLQREAKALAEAGSRDSLAAAAERYVEAAGAWQGQGDVARAADAYRLAGRTFRRIGELAAAERSARDGLELVTDGAHGRLELDLLGDVAYAQYRAGEREATVATLNLQLARTRELGDRSAEAETLANLGSVASSWGDLQEALDRYRESLELTRKIGDREHLGSTLNNLALVLGNLGEDERAVELLEEALALHREHGNRKSEATVLKNLGSRYRKMGRLPLALERFEQSLALLAPGPSLERSNLLSNLAALHLDTGDRQRAIALYRQAIEISEAVSAPLSTAGLRLGLAGALPQSAADEALRQLDQARRVFEDSDHRAGLASVLVARARWLRDLDRLDEAATAIEEAVATRDAIRGELVGGASRIGAFGVRRGDYELWVDILLRQHERQPTRGYDRQAFEISERARARGALESLAARPGAIAAAPASDHPQEVEALDREIAGLQRTLRTAPRGDLARERAEARLPEVVRQRQDLRSDRERARHDPRALLSLPTASAAQIQRLLPERTALLEYLTGEEGSVLFVVDRKGLTVHRLPPETEIEPVVRELRGRLENPSPLGVGAYARPALTLFQQLVEHAMPRLENTDHLVVAADGPLHELPFAALLTSTPTEPEYVALPYLLRRFRISYVPSATVLAELRRRPATDSASPRTALVVAGPFAPQAEGRAGGSRRRLTKSVFGPDADWSPDPLVAARREAGGIRQALGADRVSLLLDEDATEEALKSHPALSRAGYLHFATHALVSQRDPSLSGIVLALDREGDEDGLLQVPEIEQLDLHADLVTLSACRTALGREIRGEGILGLERAFLTAGARNLLVSLWSVADEGTAELMIRFYRGLRDDPAVALRQAKLALIEGGAYADPFYWASFVLRGAADGSGWTSSKR